MSDQEPQSGPSIIKSLYGAYRLARFDPAGMSYFDTSHQGFWHSFQAAILVLPLFLLTLLARWGNYENDVDPARFLIIEVIAYVIAWVAYPALLPRILHLIDREKNYVRSVVAYNWAAVLQNIVYAPIAALTISGAMATGPFTFIVLLTILAYGWFITKTSLGVKPVIASGLVVFDLTISIVLSTWTESLLMKAAS